MLLMVVVILDQSFENSDSVRTPTKAPRREATMLGLRSAKGAATDASCVLVRVGATPDGDGSSDLHVRHFWL